MAMDKPRFETYAGKDGKIYARIKGTNGKKVWFTEGYESHEAAEEAVFWLVGVMQAHFFEMKFERYQPDASED